MEKVNKIKLIYRLVCIEVLDTVKSFLFVGYQFSWVGRSTKLRIPRAMKLGKQFDICILHCSFLGDLLPNETYYVENTKYTNFILGTNTKSTKLRIHCLLIFNQTTKINTHKEKYFHSIMDVQISS